MAFKFSKSLFKSKTFWANAFTVVVTYGGILPIPPEALVYVLGAANIGLRVITKGAVYVFKDAATEP